MGILSDKTSAVVLGLALAVGAVGGAAVLGHSVAQIRSADRYVSVKGFAEREVKADLAIWPIKLRAAGNDVGEVSRSIESSRIKVTRFLAQNGFQGGEIVPQGLQIIDRQASDYTGSNIKELLRYVAESTILVRSTNVDNVERMSGMTDSLVRSGVVLSSRNEWQETGARYMFTKLKDIKPEMMGEATRNARASASQFAVDSGSRVGAIRRASQGLFTIVDRDASPPGPSEGQGDYSPAASDRFKRVRVVVTVDYFLEK
ncbi:MAG TPA: SIMPL domain-containing protein [Candidatus Saccharimonadales bacterium]|nr:SIMPL domain-containing protein [Candidatus Saccharimonadales bacterium]